MHNFTGVDVHGSILTAMRSLPMWGRAKHTALSALLGKVPVSALVLGPQDINHMLLNLSQETISSHVSFKHFTSLIASNILA